MSDWRGALGGVLPKVHTLDALMEVRMISSAIIVWNVVVERLSGA